MKHKFSYNKRPHGLAIRYTTLEDRPFVTAWLQEPGILRYFPPDNAKEVEHTMGIWMEYAKYNCSITATINKRPVGCAILYLNPFQKIAHHSLYGIILDKEFRGQGIGTEMIKTLEKMARSIGLEFLHIEVYVGNPAIKLYEKLGYKEFGRKLKFLKDKDEYIDQIMMQKDL